MKLEELHKGARVRGLSADGVATVKSIDPHGPNVAEVIFADARGALQTRIVTRDDESSLEAVESVRAWAFDGDGALLRLVSEAQRIRLAWLFDPFLALTTSTLDPLPHQIAVVYETMLPRQPLRFLLADDPGAGKTIMAGLLIKELMLRADLQRCLIVAPGSLTEQWQDELAEKFDLHFELLTRDMIDATRTANPFEERPLLIARLDQLSRNEDIRERIKGSREWDLVVCDEAHRMSAHYNGGKLKETERYKLGRVLGERCRNFLLMTATPHNGHEEDFQIFMALLDGDRFEGKFREGVHTADPSDLMRRLVKEDLYTFDGRKLFPDRFAYTVSYPFSDDEAHLYGEVTDYVKTEMNRAERFGDAEQQRRVNVGFALMTLQRRLASSPEAILRSIERRRERFEARIAEERLAQRGQRLAQVRAPDLPALSEDDITELDEEAPQDEREEVEQQVVDNATAAQTLAELEAETLRLKELEFLARAVRKAGHDAKWNQLVEVLDDPLMRDPAGNRRKLVVFTEFRDTLTYLAEKIRARLGRKDAVVEIHGGVARDDRRKVVHAFMNDPEVLVLVANDAAGEGVNLQRAHLMVNYDLPWNPNRLEQRFGRIHRIGQTEVCHLWNLIAKDSREAEVYIKLLDKLEEERKALGGRVYDVLGQLFEGNPLRDLLMGAVRFNDDPKVKARLQQRLDNATDRKHIEELLARRALAHDTMDLSRVEAIRVQMERARARRLQPHFVQSFFAEAFDKLGGRAHRREPGRWEITHVPQAIRDRDRQIGTGAPVLRRYERICFEKEHVDPQPKAHLVAPGTPLLDCTIDLILERHRDVMRRGAVLVDDNDLGEAPRVLVYLEHAVQDGRRLPSGHLQVVSQRLVFAEAGADGAFRDAGPAPYLDYWPASDAERALVEPALDAAWLKADWEDAAIGFAVRELVPAHVKEVRARRLPLVDKVEQQVKARLMKEINYWDHQAERLREQEKAGKQTRLPAHVAEERANGLSERMRGRLEGLKLERSLSPQPPRVVGGALVVPVGLLRKLAPVTHSDRSADADPEARSIVEQLAVDAVLAAERALGRTPRDVGADRRGYDVESYDPKARDVYFIEVKGRIEGADTVCLTRNEILCALNVPDRFRLAVVVVQDGRARDPVYVERFDWGAPGFAQTQSTYSLAALLRAGGPPR